MTMYMHATYLDRRCISNVRPHQPVSDPPVLTLPKPASHSILETLTAGQGRDIRVSHVEKPHRNPQTGIS